MCEESNGIQVFIGTASTGCADCNIAFSDYNIQANVVSKQNNLENTGLFYSCNLRSFADVNVVDAQASSACEVLYRTLEDDIELTTDLRGMEGFHLVEHIVMEESDLKLVNSSYEEKVVPKTVNRSKMDGGIMTTLLGKASWNVIRLSK